MVMAMNAIVPLLFWLPSATDLLLLVFTYSSCYRYGPAWWFANSPDWKTSVHNTKANPAPTRTPYNQAREMVLWRLAMIAYTGYGVLFCLSFGTAIFCGERRKSEFCWAMSLMMVLKLFHTADEASRQGILFWSLPLYMSYAVLQTFVLTD